MRSLKFLLLSASIAACVSVAHAQGKATEGGLQPKVIETFNVGDSAPAFCSTAKART